MKNYDYDPLPPRPDRNITEMAQKAIAHLREFDAYWRERARHGVRVRDERYKTAKLTEERAAQLMAIADRGHR